jgi:hypothetical protein
MGRKPFLGLVGACLASMTFTGCWDNCCLWDRSPKKDTSIPTTATTTSTGSRSTGSDMGWRERPGATGSISNNGVPTGSSVAGGSSGGTSFNGSGSVGSSSGSFNAGAGAASSYPGSTPTRGPADASGIDRASYPGSSGSDLNSGRSTQPVNYNDSTTGAGTRPTTSTLPPIVPTGSPAVPRMDDLPTGKSTRLPAIESVPAAPTSGGGLPVVPSPSTSSSALPPVPPTSSSAPLPPPEPPPGSVPTPSGAGSSDGLPPIPSAPSQSRFEQKPLPSSPPALPRSGLPSLPQNPAVMQNN